MNKLTLTVPNISCNHCAHTIKTELSDMPGIENIVVDVEKKQVMVSFILPATEDKILALLAEIKYPARR